MENSYDHANGTRFMEDQTLSPESTNKLLNPYMTSAEQQRNNGRLSSVNR